jgi:hypothetical protein
MNKKHFLILFIIMIFSISGCSTKTNKNGITNIPISEYMVGKWKTSETVTDIYGTHQEFLYIKFMSNQNLQYCNKNPIEPFCTKMTYTHLTDNYFLVENKRLRNGHWQISEKNENLIICMNYTENCREFYRDTTKFNLLREWFGILR